MHSNQRLTTQKWDDLIPINHNVKPAKCIKLSAAAELSVFETDVLALGRTG